MSEPQLLSAWVGHWTGTGTGVTVVLPPPGTVGSGEVRGGAPASREFAVLEPTRLVPQVDAVVLSGGSAFGLSAADGVMGELRARGQGFGTPFGPVPIVVGMSIFDESVGAWSPVASGSAPLLSAEAATSPGPAAVSAGSGPAAASAGSGPADASAPSAPPDAEAGRMAVRAAYSGEPLAAGRVGAGAGASTGKWRNRRDPGGFGWAEMPAGPARVAALAVVNAWGDVLGPDGHPLFARDAAALPPMAPPGTGFSATSGRPGAGSSTGFGQNTTIAVVLTDAKLSKNDCYLLAQSGHTGFARAIHPAHSRFDGDAVVALASGEVTEDVSIDLIRAVATDAMAAAIRAAVTAG
jgi:L-aminopeptidase/D-esterase-like protein